MSAWNRPEVTNFFHVIEFPQEIWKPSSSTFRRAMENLKGSRNSARKSHWETSHVEGLCLPCMFWRCPSWQYPNPCHSAGELKRGVYRRRVRLWADAGWLLLGSTDQSSPLTPEKGEYRKCCHQAEVADASLGWGKKVIEDSMYRMPTAILCAKLLYSHSKFDLRISVPTSPGRVPPALTQGTKTSCLITNEITNESSTSLV